MGLYQKMSGITRIICPGRCFHQRLGRGLRAIFELHLSHNHATLSTASRLHFVCAPSSYDHLYIKLANTRDLHVCTAKLSPKRRKVAVLPSEKGDPGELGETSSLLAEMFLAEEMSEQSQQPASTGDDESDLYGEELTHLFEAQEIARKYGALAHLDAEMDDEDALSSSGRGSVSSPAESMSTEECEEELSLDDLKLPIKTIYGDTDPKEPISDVPCGGCGALLHCQDPGIPGYMPAHRFKGVSKPELRTRLCHRCKMMWKHKIAVDLAVPPEEYEQILRSIKKEIALVVVVVDIMDMENSLFKNLPNLIGKRRPVFVVGNKIDLLPKDEKNYLNRTKERLAEMCEKYGLTTSNRVQHIALVSAKTGYGIESLVTKLMKEWSRKGHVYVVGCTNVGKSTLFNALLSSDYCKSSARDFIRRATTSVWPGTTLRVLKFPVVDPTPLRMFERTRRLIEDRTAERKAKREGKNQEVFLSEGIGKTFKGAREKLQEEMASTSYVGASYTFSTADGGIAGTDRTFLKMDSNLKQAAGDYDESVYEESRWCFDTPGVVNPEQVINILTQKELSVILSKRIVLPRTFTMKPGRTMFVSGLGRIDYLKGSTSIYFTVMTCHALKVHVLDTQDADEFYRDHIGTTKFGVPLGDAERLQRLPALIGREFHAQGTGWKESLGDVLLSSVGWVALSAGKGMDVQFRVYTPGGRGCSLRQPALLPFAVNLKGPRQGKTAAYKLRQYKYREE